MLWLRNARELNAFRNRHKSADPPLWRQHSLASINLWLAPLEAFGSLWASLSLNWSGVPWRIMALLHQPSLPRVHCKTNTGKGNWLQFLGQNFLWIRLFDVPTWRRAGFSDQRPNCQWAQDVRLSFRADFEGLCIWWNPGLWISSHRDEDGLWKI